MDEREKLIEIVDGCKAGCAESFAVLVDMYSSRLHSYFYRLSGNTADADDLLGELFLKVIEKISTCRAESFNFWIFRIARNLFIDHLRAKKRWKTAFQQVSEQVSDVLPPPDFAEDVDELTRQLAILDLSTSEAIIMRFYGQLSFAEIAKIKGEPVGTTLSRVHRGLKKLRELMEK